MFHIALEQFLHEHFLGCFRISYPLARTSGSVSAVAAVCVAAAVLFLSQRGKQKVWGKSFSKIDIFCQCSDVPEQGCPTENKYLCSYLVLVFLWLFSLLWKCQWKRWSQGKEKKGAIISPNFPPNGKIAAKCLEVLRLKKIPFLQVLKGLWIEEIISVPYRADLFFIWTPLLLWHLIDTF